MRKKKVKIKKSIKVAFYSFILLVILSIYTILNSDIFNLKEININGNEILTKDDIIKITSIEFNKNIFQYKLKNLEHDMESNPYIKEVDIKRKFSNKLVIDIKENSEDAIIINNKNYIYIQNDGLILSEKRDITNKNIPIIESLDLEDYKIGTCIKIKNESKQKRLLYLLECLDENNMKREIDKIIVEKNFIKMQNDNGIDIVLNLDNNIQYNIKRLNQILVDLKTKGISKGNIDLRNKDQAVYSPL